LDGVFVDLGVGFQSEAIDRAQVDLDKVVVFVSLFNESIFVHNCPLIHQLQCLYGNHVTIVKESLEFRDFTAFFLKISFKANNARTNISFSGHSMGSNFM
jgi:hypothetical protein